MPNIPTKLRSKLITWHLTDSALPTGAFAHSAGLETYIQRDIVSDAASYSAWLSAYLLQASYTEALALRFAMELATSERSDEEKLDGLAELDRLCHVSQTPRQVRTSMNAMGKRMAKVATITVSDDPLISAYLAGIDDGSYHGNPGIAAGLAFGASQISIEDGVYAYLLQMASSMTQNAIRGIPLGQDAGQRVLAESYAYIEKSGAATLEHTLADLGSVAPGLEVAQMMHESLHSRMFMS